MQECRKFLLFFLKRLPQTKPLLKYIFHCYKFKASSEVLSWEISWLLANADVKAKLLKSLEKTIPTLDELPFDNTLIYDGMCIIQQLPSGLDTFGTISEFVLKRITRNNASEIFFVTDQYFETSIKGGEQTLVKFE